MSLNRRVETSSDIQANQLVIDDSFTAFINDEVLPQTGVSAEIFWSNLSSLVYEYAEKNRDLLLKREALQKQIDNWHTQHQYSDDTASDYQTFLQDIGYLEPAVEDFEITTSNVDAEIARIAGPQLVVPLKNARFTLNAANARWGSLYDALYGTDVIPKIADLQPGYDKRRGAQVIAYGREFLDEIFPLAKGSHKDATGYFIYYDHLVVGLNDDETSGLKNPSQYVAYTGSKSKPDSILLLNNGLHVEIDIDHQTEVGREDTACVSDILIESAVTTIVDCEDSIAAVDCEDKLEVYRNWLGLMTGELSETFTKGGKAITRQLNQDRVYTAKFESEQEEYVVPGRSLLFIRNVGLLMETDIVREASGELIPEGILDTVVTVLISLIDIRKTQGLRNSREGSIYIVKPKMHGPEEVAFTNALFAAVEDAFGLERNTIKLGIMDEERRTTVNLKSCIHAAKDRVVFINTGFLDRTGDEIHTSMQAGAFLPKGEIKQQVWIDAYENWNVDIGLNCGLQGKAQIGKGMWAMPDEMGKMMEQKIAHPYAGANTAWVPSPTAATLHALHYHRVNVFEIQDQLKMRECASLGDILTVPLMSPETKLSAEVVQQELDNNAQGILGYVVRWIDQGIGCSKVPDIHDVGLMEDRATLRISSQHMCNWLLHNICTKEQIVETMQRMAVIVDQQNANDSSYRNMAPDFDNSIAYQAALALVFEGADQPSGYTEPLLHAYRAQAKLAH